MIRKIEDITNKHIFIGFISIFLTILLYEFLTQKSGSIEKTMTTQSVDTLIPNGMTLVPIEIQNSSALSELIGQFGVIDLYVTPHDPAVKPRKVASQIKIMRAPLNPNIYAVLVKDEDAIHIAKHSGQFFVTVLNPKSKKFQIEQVKNKKIFKIESEI